MDIDAKIKKIKHIEDLEIGSCKILGEISSEFKAIIAERDSLRAQLETTKRELMATDISWQNALAELDQLRESSTVPAMPIPKQEPVCQDREMLIALMSAFDTEHSICENCGHQEETMYMDSANMLRDYLQSNPVPAQAAAIPEWQPIETMPFNTPVLVSDEKIIASMFFYKRKDRGYENSLYPQFIGAGDAEVRVSLYPSGCWPKLKWWRPMLDLPLSASPKPE